MSREEEVARAAAAAAESRTIERLRAFTGIGHLVPDLDQPEHVAYLRYRDQLQERLVELENGVGRRERQLDSASREEYEADRVSGEVRSQHGLVRWVISAERRQATRARRSSEVIRDQVEDIGWLRRQTVAELGAVQWWLHDWLAAAEAERRRQDGPPPA